jgi:hypothetical protein
MTEDQIITTVRLGELRDLALARARKDNLKLSELLRRAVRHYLTGQGGDDWQKLRVEVSNLRAESARIGGNLNQIAHHANIHQAVDGQALPKVIAELKAHFRDVADQMRAINDKLGR